jgi:hypothetical protein
VVSLTAGLTRDHRGPTAVCQRCDGPTPSLQARSAAEDGEPSDLVVARGMAAQPAGEEDRKQAVAGARPGSTATASWRLIRQSKARRTLGQPQLIKESTGSETCSGNVRSQSRTRPFAIDVDCGRKAQVKGRYPRSRQPWPVARRTTMNAASMLGGRHRISRTDFANCIAARAFRWISWCSMERCVCFGPSSPCGNTVLLRNPACRQLGPRLPPRSKSSPACLRRRHVPPKNPTEPNRLSSRSRA